MNQEEVISTLRASLLSAKGGIKLQFLTKDYQTITGQSIPFKNLGFSTLEQFLRTVPGIRLVPRGVDLFVEAQPTDNSAHISRLISKQKTPKKTKKKMTPQYRNTNSFRMPKTKKGGTLSEREVFRFYSDNQTHNWPRANVNNKIGRPNTARPLMEIPVQCPTMFANERKVTQPATGVPSSPSMRPRDPHANFTVSVPNQSSIKAKDSVHLRNNAAEVTASVINQEPKTAPNNTDNVLTRRYPSHMIDRLDANSSISSRLHIASSQQSELLSPLSPAQLVGGSNHIPTGGGKGDAKHVPKPDDVYDSRQQLRIRVRFLGLEAPTFKVYRHSNVFYAQVQVDGKKYSGYPQEATTEEDAEKIAANLALEELNKLAVGPPMTETTDKREIIQRVMAIMDNHKNGVFLNQIPMYYMQQFKEQLPKDWHKIIEECPDFTCEKGVNSTILHRCEPCKTTVYPTLTSKFEKIQLSPLGLVTPGQIKLPDDTSFFPVVVTCIVSVVEIWVRLDDKDHKEEFETMVNDLGEHYKSIKMHSKTDVKVGNYYAVFDDTWYRVKCIEYDSSTDRADVIFIDYGDEGSYSSSQLYPLDKQFAAVPGQAIRVCLAGLEEFGECDKLEATLNELLSKLNYYIEVIKQKEDEEGTFVSVVFYDTSPVDEDIVINGILIEELLNNVLVPPKLQDVTGVYISYVDANGDIYIQIQNLTMKYFIRLMNRLLRDLQEKTIQPKTSCAIDVANLYLVSSGGKWYRGKITRLYPDNRIGMQLIDFGRSIMTESKNLIQLKQLFEDTQEYYVYILSELPAQAFKIRLQNIETSMFDDRVITRLNELAPLGELLLASFDTSSNHDVPVVELFKRIQPDNILASINKTLAFEKDLSRSNGDGNNNVKPKKRIERTLSRISNEDSELTQLQPPPISKVDEYFDVHIPMAAHPGNFVVQPYESKLELQALMERLEDYYNNCSTPAPALESIKEGKLYAGKHSDGRWYRVCISNIISPTTISAYLCDFGFVDVFTLENLRPLKTQFLKLPYQAIKAKLVGIQPTNVDWLPEDSCEFRDIVVGRNFVSIVKESISDNLSPLEKILGLVLVDVSTDKDIYIHELLAKKGIGRLSDVPNSL